MPSAALLSRHSDRDPRFTRTPRISWRRRIRAILRNLTDFIREILATPGYRRREDFMKIAAREAHERSEAIDASVGAMSPADIRRIAPSAPLEYPPRH
jgi:hypothetical protein